MKKPTLTLSCLAAILAVCAENKQTVTIEGSVVAKNVAALAFSNSEVTLTFEDGTITTADMQSVSIDLTYDSSTSGITTVECDKEKQQKIYSISGKAMGGSIEALPKGLYIKDGKKVVIK